MFFGDEEREQIARYPVNLFTKEHGRKKERIMETIVSINGAINSVVWGPPMMILLIGVGILMTIRMKGLQFRKFGFERVFFKPDVDSPMDVAARAYEAQVNAEIRHMEMHHGM